jgi:Cytochrome c554 and c-prime
MNGRIARRTLGLGLALALRAAIAHGDLLPQDAPDLHLGVSSCSSPLCHNAITPWNGSNVRLNEYRIWRERDHHARAFVSLEMPLGKQIGRALGITPVTAPECLACHIDSVAPDRRAPDFNASDGVACEACHGGAERWIESHSKVGASHEDNVRLGMYRTEDPRRRAELCVSCHLGTSRKMVTHEMLAAGHPRLSFELDTFTQLAPPHWPLRPSDPNYESYVERKHEPVGDVQAWAVGQAVALRAYLGLLADPRLTRPRWPEFGLFDCATCHRDVQKGTSLSDHGTPVGLPGLSEAPFVLYERLLTVTLPSGADRIDGELVALNRLMGARSTEIGARATALCDRVGRTLDAISTVQLNHDQVLAALAGCSRSPERLTYLEAEQLTMGIEATLASMYGEAALARDSTVRGMLDATQSLGRFDPVRFQSALHEICARRAR